MGLIKGVASRERSGDGERVADGGHQSQVGQDLEPAIKDDRGARVLEPPGSWKGVVVLKDRAEG
jgi:hypothetical protein